MASSRRVFLRTTAGLVMAAGAAASLATPAAAAPAVSGADPVDPDAATIARAAHESAGVLPGERSPNGWSVNTAANAGGSVWTRPVPGTAFDVDVSIGAAETVLVHVIRRFHYELAELRPGDVIGYREPAGLSSYEVNHASGTAIDIRPGSYPRGVRGGFFPLEVAVIRDILADCEGVVRWGGDFRVPDEAHFQIDVPPGDERMTRLVAKLHRWNTTPGAGAGVIPDTRAADRLEASRRLERAQRV